MERYRERKRQLEGYNDGKERWREREKKRKRQIEKEAKYERKRETDKQKRREKERKRDEEMLNFSHLSAYQSRGQAPGVQTEQLASLDPSNRARCWVITFTKLRWRFSKYSSRKENDRLITEILILLFTVIWKHELYKFCFYAKDWLTFTFNSVKNVIYWEDGGDGKEKTKETRMKWLSILT